VCAQRAELANGVAIVLAEIRDVLKFWRELPSQSDQLIPAFIIIDRW
jgi:hypothetical protein